MILFGFYFSGLLKILITGDWSQSNSVDCDQTAFRGV